ncbi:MAG TPA: DNA mismatch repair endonuclease MutH [Gammaproteobacteria bacterium]
MTMNLATTPPESIDELMKRATAIAGMRLGQLAQQWNVAVPLDLRREKGWVGQLIERALGASAASLAEPDFQLIGVELKTIPLDRHGRPRESTYVCTVPLETEAMGQRWEISWVRRKLATVLWMPVEGDNTIALAERRIGNPLLWCPTAEEEALLRNDWEELMEMICTGQLESITASLGEALQIRPKAASASVRGRAIGVEGTLVRTNPRGFYLRSRFTAAILQRSFISGE